MYVFPEASKLAVSLTLFFLAVAEEAVSRDKNIYNANNETFFYRKIITKEKGAHKRKTIIFEMKTHYS